MYRFFLFDFDLLLALFSPVSHLESTFFLILLQLFHSDFEVQQTTSHLSRLLWSEMGKSFTTMTLRDVFSSVLGEMLGQKCYTLSCYPAGLLLGDWE